MLIQKQKIRIKFQPKISCKIADTELGKNKQGWQWGDSLIAQLETNLEFRVLGLKTRPNELLSWVWSAN